MHFLKTFFECFFIWHLKGTDDFSGADCIIAHAGAETVDGQPGSINEFLDKTISNIIYQLGNATNLPIIAQGELAKYLENHGVIVSAQTPKQSGGLGYIDTVWVTKFFKEVCGQNGWRRPILVSHHPHLWRGMMVARKLGMEVIIPEIAPGIYDPECSQWWMRSPWFNTPRELACRFLWLLQGKI